MLHKQTDRVFVDTCESRISEASSNPTNFVSPKKASQVNFSFEFVRQLSRFAFAPTPFNVLSPDSDPLESGVATVISFAFKSPLVLNTCLTFLLSEQKNGPNVCVKRWAQCSGTIFIKLLFVKLSSRLFLVGNVHHADPPSPAEPCLLEDDPAVAEPLGRRFLLL